jgi:hypothetical protein
LLALGNRQSASLGALRVGPSSIASLADTGLKAWQANSLSISLNDRSWQIFLQKSFCAVDREFSEL